MTPANATDVQQLSPQHSQSLMNPNSKLNLRTPSSFIPKGFQVPFKPNLTNPLNNMNPTPSKTDVIKVQTQQAESETNPMLPQYQSSLENVTNSSHLAQTSTVPKGSYAFHSNDSVIRSDGNLKSNPINYGVEHTKHSSIIASQEYPQTTQAHQSVPINPANPNLRKDETRKHNSEFSKGIPIDAEISQQTISSEDLLLPSSMRASNIGGRNLNQETRPIHIQNELCQVGDEYNTKNDCTPSAALAEMETIK